MTTGKTRWIPLESNPDIFNSWANAAGLVPSSSQFGDIYGLDPDLLSMVPQPIKALVLVFPYTEIAKSDTRKSEEERLKKERETGSSEVDPTVIFIKQTIGNACGTMALLHALMNSDVVLTPGSALEKFIEQCKDLTPLARSELLSSTPLFAEIHKENAQAGQSAIPTDLKVDLHYTCFIEAPAASVRAGDTEKMAALGETGLNRLIELDGNREGPVDHGPCTDLLKDAAKICKEQFIDKSKEISFNMMYLGSAPDF
ncbi:hypothetical protein DL96DRAFT_1623171 [Flagelloscypha sp. PMI_526]|nr:hypothetical protein DL96DRAFT_1623171 [Flagelloscypha sp. PMI_526]